MSYTNLEFFKMTLDDLHEIEPILENEFDDFWTKATLENELVSNNSYYIIAKQNEEIVGFARNEICFR